MRFPSIHRNLRAFYFSTRRAAYLPNPAMKLRDTIALCCKSPGDLQKDLLRTSIEQVITDGGGRDLETVKSAYEQALAAAGKGSDSIVSRFNELTGLACFTPDLSLAELSVARGL